MLLDHGGLTPEIKHRSCIDGQSLGLYFHINDELRVNYVSIQLIHEATPDPTQSRFWLNLLSPPTEHNKSERRKYAELVGNITPEQVGLHIQIHYHGALLIHPKLVPNLRGCNNRPRIWNTGRQESHWGGVQSFSQTRGQHPRHF